MKFIDVTDEMVDLWDTLTSDTQQFLLQWSVSETDEEVKNVLLDMFQMIIYESKQRSWPEDAEDTLASIRIDEDGLVTTYSRLKGIRTMEQRAADGDFDE